MINQAEKEILSAFPPEVTEQVQAILNKWKQKAVIACLLAVSACTVLTLIFHNGKKYLTDSICLAAFFSVCGLYVALLLIETTVWKAYRQIPLLTAQPENSASPEETLARRKEAAAGAHIMAGLLAAGAVGVFIFIPDAALFSFFLLAGAVWVEADRMNKFPTDLSAARKLRVPLHRRSRRIGCCAALVFVVSCCAMVFRSIMGSVAGSRLGAINATAQNVYLAAEKCLTDYDYKDISVEPVTTIAQFSEDNLFSNAWQTYFKPPKQTDWYALVFDDNGKLLFALYSQMPITEEQLTKPDQEEQRKLLRSFSHKDEAIGYYTRSQKKSEASS